MEGFLLISHFRDIKNGHPVGQIVGRLVSNILDEIGVIFLVIIRRIIGGMIQAMVDSGCFLRGLLRDRFLSIATFLRGCVGMIVIGCLVG
jgi:hypothetical protein